jgi:RNase P subunit RPR2
MSESIGSRTEHWYIQKAEGFEVTENVACKRCGAPLKDGRIILFLRGNMLGTRIVIECNKCGRLHRFEISEPT